MYVLKKKNAACRIPRTAHSSQANVSFSSPRMSSHGIGDDEDWWFSASCFNYETLWPWSAQRPPKHPGKTEKWGFPYLLLTELPQHVITNHLDRGRYFPHKNPTVYPTDQFRITKGCCYFHHLPKLCRLLNAFIVSFSQRKCFVNVFKVIYQ